MKRNTRIVLGIGIGVLGVLCIGGVFYVFKGEPSSSGSQSATSHSDQKNGREAIIKDTKVIEGTRKLAQEQSASSQQNTSSNSSLTEDDAEDTERSASSEEESPESNSQRSESNTEQNTASVSIGSPSEPQVWTSGTTHTIAWESQSSVERVSIQLTPSSGFCGGETCTSFVNGNVPRYTLAEDVANTGTFEWQVPPLNNKHRKEGAYVFLITQPDGQTVLAKSAPVALQNPDTRSRLDLVFPNDLATPQAKPGEFLLLRWGKSPDVFRVDITLQRVSCGESQCSPQFKTHSIVQGENSQIYSWRIPPKIDKGTYRIIVQKAYGQIEDSGTVEITSS